MIPTSHWLGALGLVVATSACATASSSDPNTGPEQDIKAGGGRVVTGAKADRILAALSPLDAVDHAMGGRASAEVANLVCVSRSNVALDESDPSYRVPITQCDGDVAGRTPPHVTKADAAQNARVMFEALAAVDASLGDAAMGKAYVVAKSVSCAGQNADVSCRVTNEAGKTFNANGGEAKRIVQAFALVDRIDHAMGGRYGVDATEVKCQKATNQALDESSPSFGVPTFSCSANVAGFVPPSVSIADAPTDAANLMDALEKAGVQPDAAMGGKLGLSIQRLTCRKGPGADTFCTLE